MKAILVLEDEPAVMRLLRSVLTAKGYLLLEATGAEEAIQRAQQWGGHIRLLIANVVLPVSSGIRVALQLKQATPLLKIILISGYPVSMWSDQHRAELGELPSDSVVILQKPFSQAVLVENVGGLIGTSMETNPNHKTAAGG